METNKSSKNRLGFASAFLLAALVFLGIVINTNSNLKTSLNTEKLKQDSILSTKLLLDKEIIGLTMEVNSLKGKNAKLDSVLIQTSLKLNEKVVLITKLLKENGAVKKLKKELQQLRTTRDNLNKQLDEITSDYKNLSNENGKLKKQIESLEERLAIANAKENKPSAGFIAQNFRIEFQRKNQDKVTVKSKRTKNIQIQFDLNSAESKSGEQTLYIKILNPKGYVVNPNVVPVFIRNEKITYTIQENIQLDGVKKRVILDVKPESKMKQKGIYKILVYHPGDGLIGSTEVKIN